MGKSFFFVVCFLLVSCGGSHDKKSGKKIAVTPPVVTTPPQTPEEEPAPPLPTVSSFTTPAGAYPLKVSALNKKVSRLNGSGTLNLSEESLRLSLNAKLAAPMRSVYQSLYEGECPTLEDDRNGDGYIDIAEAQTKLRRKILTLDSNLNSETSSQNVFPRSSLIGRYTYSQTGIRKSILENITKNFGVIEIDLKDTVVLIQGTFTFLRFPNSVESSDHLPVSETLPVGCAVVHTPVE